MRKSNSIILVTFICSIILICISCREEIIPPDNFAGNINEPLETNDQNSYIFILDAKKLNVDYRKEAYFSTFNTRISITIVDYTSGSIRFQIKDNQSYSRFSYYGNKNVELYTKLLNGFVPMFVELKTTDFTGKLKIQLRAAY